MTSINYSQIAREAFRKLATRKLPPTPANYQMCYNEIIGHPNVAGFPEANLRAISRALSARNPEQKKWLDQLDASIGKHSWQGIEEALSEFTRAMTEPTTMVAADGAIQTQDRADSDHTELRMKIASMIECGLPALGSADELFSRKSEDLLRILRDPESTVYDVHTELGDFSHRLSFIAEEQAEIKIVLLDLLHLILENVSALSLDDSWLKGQVDGLLAAVEPPLDLRRLDDVKQRVREVMARQSVAKARTLEAQEEMRRMLSDFIGRLSSMSESSFTFQHKIEESARRMEGIKTFEDLSPLLQDIIATARDMAKQTSQEHDQLESLKNKASATEEEITKLQQELLRASDSARHDPLTSALNRKGLEEALIREIAIMRRKETPLSVAFLDIDNFKKLNDRLGHESGDAALIHLVNIVRLSLRPADTLARYGGEEFVILMPDSALGDAIKAMQRCQRDLTKRFFLSGNEKVLITFSAGVAQFSREESGADAIRRADQAMYLAKRTGKNRVLGG